MCGIFGMISKKARPFNKRAFCTMGVRNDSRGGDSCGIFIDGDVEYGVDKEKLFINFFRDSILLEYTKECQVALGHCRKASVGKVSIETAQPVVIKNENGDVDYVLIHNGTIYNYKELAKKYIPDVNIDGMTDSQVMARIFYYSGYDSLNEYIGGAVFVIHDYRINKSFIFKGSSKKYATSKEPEEERPLYYCWHNGRFIFSSIFETLYAFYYDEVVYNFPSNVLVSIKGEKLRKVKDYPRDTVTQAKPISMVSRPTIWDNDYYGYYDNSNDTYRIKYDGTVYLNNKNEPIHGIYYVSSYGWLYPNKTKKESWLEEVAFFRGRMLKHPDAFKLVNKKFLETNQTVTKEVETLINILDFNPFNVSETQYYWFDGEDLMIPQGEWLCPMVDWSCVFDEDGNLTNIGNKPYTGWPTDYHMYTYDEAKILDTWKKLCVEE